MAVSYQVATEIHVCGIYLTLSRRTIEMLYYRQAKHRRASPLENTPQAQASALALNLNNRMRRHIHSATAASTVHSQSNRMLGCNPLNSMTMNFWH